MPLAGQTIRAWGDPQSSTSAVDETTAPGTTFVAPTNAVGHSFVAPPSGNVLVILADRLELTAVSGTDSVFSSVRIGTGATVGAGTEVVAPSTDEGCSVSTSSTAVIGASFAHTRLVTGLTPGDTYNAQYRWRDNGGPAAVASRNRTVTTIPLP